MVDISQIREHMEVVGSDGERVGTVDHIEGTDRIKLTRQDSPDGEHHFLPLTLVTGVDGDRVTLGQPASQVRSRFGAAG